MSNGASSGSQYTFLPYVRRGLSANIPAAAGATPQLTPPSRAQLLVNLSLQAAGGTAAVNSSAQQTVLLYGPGDVTGFNPNHIVKTEPRDGTPNFEPDYFAGIEFDQPDFPWLFSPAGPDSNNRIPPWIVLIVLSDAEVGGLVNAQPLPYIDVKVPAVLPDLSESWAWAHVQVAGDQPANTDLSDLLVNSPQQTISRLLCARHLDPSTHYQAFVVPAFDAGVQAGLGQAPSNSGQLGPAWVGTEQTVRLPVFSSFEFSTSDAGDFESLVRKLAPHIAPASTGTRPMSVKDSGAPWVSDDPSAAPMLMFGALEATDVPAGSFTWNDGAAFQSDLGTLLTDTAGLAIAPAGTVPKIGPPFYGRWHTGVHAIAPGDPGWLGEVNLDPRNRAVAGLGTYVVLQERNQLMRSAWQQFQYVEAANQRLRRMQAARATSGALYQANFVPADPPTLLAWTNLVQRRVLYGTGQSVSATIVQSPLPIRTLSAASRRILRPFGPLRQRSSSSGPPYTSYTKLNNGTVQIAPPAASPAGLPSYTGELDGLIPPWIPRWVYPFAKYLPWILLLIALVIGLIVWLVAGPVAAFVAAVILLALIYWLVRGPLSSTIAVGSVVQSLQPTNLTPSSFANAPAQSTFQVEQFGVASPGPISGTAGTDSPDAGAFRSGMEGVVGLMQATFANATSASPAPLQMGAVSTTLISALNPETTLVQRAGMVVKLNPSLNWPGNAMDPLEPVMAYPVFPQPMYEPLRDWSQELLLPGVGDIAQNSLTLLQENHAFVEAYMLGLNVEMGRQLLWNGFPTDQRGSYFRQFWDTSAVYPRPANLDTLLDIPPIDQWPIATDLGDNDARGIPNNVVLLLRGELLRRYPNTHIYACPAAVGTNGNHILDDDPSQYVLPLYCGSLDPDIAFRGFNLTSDEALSGGPNNQGYFFVFEQVTGELRFGLEPDAAPHATVLTWGDLSWWNLEVGGAAVTYASPGIALQGSIAITDTVVPANTWAATINPAQLAYITFRQPARVAIHAEMMLRPKTQWYAGPGQWTVPTFVN